MLLHMCLHSYRWSNLRIWDACELKYPSCTECNQSSERAVGWRLLVYRFRPIIIHSHGANITKETWTPARFLYGILNIFANCNEVLLHKFRKPGKHDASGVCHQNVTSFQCNYIMWVKHCLECCLRLCCSLDVHTRFVLYLIDYFLLFSCPNHNVHFT